MNIEAVKEFMSLRDELRECGIIGVSVWAGDGIHMSLERIVEIPNFQVLRSDYDDEKYPYRVVAEIDGIHFHALVRQSQVDMPELVDQIRELEEVSV